MKKMEMKGLLARLVAFLWRLGYLYLLMAALRLIFVVVCAGVLGDISLPELPDIISGGLLFDSANLAYTFVFFVVLSLVPLPLWVVRKRWYRGVLLSLFLLGVVVVLAFSFGDTMYFQFAQKRLTGEEFHFAQNNDNSLLVILRATVEHWYLVLFLVGFVWLSLWVFRRTEPAIGPRLEPSKAAKKPQPAWLYYTLNSLLLVVGVAYLVISMRGGVGRDVRPITPNHAAGYTTTANKAAIVQTNPFSVLRTMGKAQVPTPHFFDRPTLDSILYSAFMPKHPTDTLFGSQRGKNVVIVVLESFSAEHSAHLYPTVHPQSFTPTLDSLMQISYTFTRAYANGQKSIEALPAILSSVPSMGIFFANHSSALGQTDGIGSVVGDMGYSSVFYNGSPRGSMGFDAATRLAGIQSAVSMDDYTMHHGRAEYDGVWGIWDEPFLQYFNDGLSQTPQPFLATVFTISSHHPFKVPSRYEDSLPTGPGKIHKPVAYTDHAVRQFLLAASAQEWYQNTVFVFVADHVSGDLSQAYSQTPIGVNHIVCFIHTPDGSLVAQDHRITQQIDLQPTLRHLLGDSTQRFAMGRNIFDTTTMPFAISANNGHYQWVEQDTIYRKTIEQLAADNDPGLDNFRAFVQEYGQRIKNADLSARTPKKNIAENLEP